MSFVLLILCCLTLPQFLAGRAGQGILVVLLGRLHGINPVAALLHIVWWCQLWIFTLLSVGRRYSPLWLSLSFFLIGQAKGAGVLPVPGIFRG